MAALIDAHLPPFIALALADGGGRCSGFGRGEGGDGEREQRREDDDAAGAFDGWEEAGAGGPSSFAAARLVCRGWRNALDGAASSLAFRVQTLTVDDVREASQQWPHARELRIVSALGMEEARARSRRRRRSLDEVAGAADAGRAGEEDEGDEAIDLARGLSAEIVRAVGEAFPRLRRLDVSNCHHLHMGAVEALGSLSSLRELRLAVSARRRRRSHGEGDGEGAGGPRRHLNAIQSLGAEGARGFQGLTGLEELDMSMSTAMTDGGMRSLGESLMRLDAGRLRSLSLSGCHRITSEGVRAFLSASAPAALRRLARLDLSGCRLLCDEAVRHLCECEHLQLRSLVVAGQSSVMDLTDASLAMLAGCAGLRLLDASDCWRLTDAGLRALGEPSASALAGSLECLNISAAYEVGDEGVEHLANLKRLRALSLRSCFRITGRGLKAIARSLADLIHLDLSHTDLDDAALEELASPAARGALRRLSVASCDRLTDAAVAAVASAFPNLENLNLHGCYRITDASVAAHVVPRLPHIRTLSVNGCFLLSDAGVSPLGRLERLAQLNCTGLAGITDASIAALFAGDAAPEGADARASQLRELVLDGCVQLTDAAAAVIGRRSRLSSLSMSGCAQLTDAGVASLAGLTMLCLRSLDLSSCPRLTGAAARSLAEEHSLLVELDLSLCADVDAESKRALQRTVAALGATEIS